MAQFKFDFEFDHWRMLAETDPAAFFAARERVLEQFIEAAPARLTAELGALQALIDCSRVEAGSPIVASRQLLGMLGDHLAALSDHMADLRKQTSALVTTRSPDASG